MLHNSDTDTYISTGQLFRFRYGWVYQLLTSVNGDLRRETQFLKADANHTMLTPSYPNVWHILWCLRSQFISACQDLKSQLHASTVENPTTSFQNPQVLRTISSGYDVIHTPAPFLVWGFIMTNCNCRILSAWV